MYTLPVYISVCMYPCVSACVGALNCSLNAMQMLLLAHARVLCVCGFVQRRQHAQAWRSSWRTDGAILQHHSYANGVATHTDTQTHKYRDKLLPHQTQTVEKAKAIPNYIEQLPRKEIAHIVSHRICVC